MLAYNLNDLSNVKPLVDICEKYKPYFNVDIIHGHYVVDGCSYLGVCSMCPNIVSIVPVLPEIIDEGTRTKYFQFNQEIMKLGRESHESNWAEKVMSLRTV